MSMLPAFVVTPVNGRRPSKEGEVLPVSLEQTISGHTGFPEKGPHPVGKAEVLPDTRLRISIIDTNAGRHAIAMLNDDLIDVVVSGDTVRLRVDDEN